MKNWLFTSKNYVIIELVLLGLFELSRLLAGNKWLDSLCGSGTAPTCIGSACTTVAYTPSCSRLLGDFGMKIFLPLFLVYLVLYLVYRIYKKNFKSSVFPIISVITIFFAADWIIRSLIK
jgi:hypothetical protein